MKRGRSVKGARRLVLFLALFGLSGLCGLSGLPAGAPAAQAGPISLSGLLDLCGADPGNAVTLNYLNMGGSAFDPYRFRVFADAVPDRRISLFTQVMWGEEFDPEVVGAYVDVAPWPERDLHLQAGKIPWWIGTYAPRTYSNKNPLVGAPLLYQYHTSFPYNHLPPDADALLAQAGQGQFGVSYDPSYRAGRGLPILYDACWDFGVMAIGSMRPLEFSLGFVNGAPSSSQPGRDNNQGKSVLGRIGASPAPGLRLGVSGSIGPYLDDEVGELVPGIRVEDFDQRLVMADLAYAAGHAEFISEGYVNEWETPTVGNLDVRGYYVEAKYTFPLGFYAAARWDEMFFGEIADSTGASYPWDANVRRIEAGGGYRFSKQIIAKAIYQWNRLDPERGENQVQHYGVGAVQLSVAF